MTTTTTTRPQQVAPTGDATLDPAALEVFLGQMIGHMSGAATCVGVWLGDELGLYGAMAGQGQVTAEDLASRTRCHPRLVREWLDGQAAAGLVHRHADSDTYSLSTVHAAVLADEESPAFLARAMNSFGAMFIGVPKVVDAFRGDGGLPWGAHDDCLFSGTEWFFRPGYRAFLTTQWLPALDGVVDMLTSGGRVADVGCGHGASIVAMAQAFPHSRFTGVDTHAPSIDVARKRVADAGVADRVTLHVASATTYDGTYDLICFFDCLHDMGDPVAAARHARQRLDDDGAILLVEPMALDGRDANITHNPLAPMMYHASATLCVPNSLSQETGTGLGAQAGEATLRQVFTEAGFSRFRRAAETPTNLIIEARP